MKNPFTRNEEERGIDQVVGEYGTLPNDELYHQLKPASANLAEIDQHALVHDHPQAIRTNTAGAYRLFRIGDAVMSRDVTAAIYEAKRLAKDF
jgi:hypothetical protein